MLASYHPQNKCSYFLNIRNSHVLADLSQAEGQVRRCKLFDKSPWCTLQCLINEASVPVLWGR